MKTILTIRMNGAVNEIVAQRGNEVRRFDRSVMAREERFAAHDAVKDLVTPGWRNRRYRHSNPSRQHQAA